MPHKPRPPSWRHRDGPEHDAHARAIDDGARAGSLLQQLKEISALLSRFDSVERVLSEIVAIMGRTIPIESAIALLETPEHGKTIVWRAPDLDEPTMTRAMERARAAYAYLLGRAAVAGRVDLETAGSMRRLDPAANSVLLPLVTPYGAVFGALALGAQRPLSELDLSFVSSIINQLSLAIDRKTQHEFARAVACSVDEGIVAVDLEERITFINPAAERMLGATKSSALGKPARRLLEVRTADGAPLPADQSVLTQVLRDGAAVHSDEQMIASTSGMVFPASYNAAAILREGLIWGVVLVFQDIGERKRSEKRQRLLSDSTALLGASLDYPYALEVVARLAVADIAGLCIVDLIDDEGRIQRLPPACADHAKRALVERLGHLPPELDWETPEAVVLRSGEAVRLSSIPEGGLDAIAHGPEHAEILRGLGLHSLISVPLQHAGRILGALTLGTLEPRELTDADFELARELGRRAAVAMDNVRSHREALEAIKSREDVVSTVSHDLKTPLTSLLMSSRMLTESPELAPSSRRSVEIMQRAAERMTALIDQLLDFTRVSAGRLVLRRRAETVGRLVADALTVIEPLASAKSIRIEVKISDPASIVVCDRDRVLQVLTNVLGNAVKFTPDGGAIGVHTKRDGQNVRFALADSGPGVSTEQLPHLFERYWQAPASARGGTGLGLAIAKGMVEAHGGRIWAVSTPGQGTTVFFTLPMANDGDGA